MDATQPLSLPRSRRHALRLMIGLGLAAVPAVRLAGEAAAGRSWCRFDPTVVVDGELVHLYVSGLVDTTYVVSGPTEVVIRIPRGVASALIEQDAGFGQGYTITFAEDRKLKAESDRVEIAADVYVPTTRLGKGQPILVEWVPDGTVKVATKQEGVTNDWISAETKIKRGR